MAAISSTIPQLRRCETVKWPAALEGLGNLLIMNLATFYGEKVAMKTLRDIAANAAPVAHRWDALAASEDHEPGHA